MKLKKIVSLALAGVMAVSMLAGCANNGGNGGNDSGKEPVTQPATGVAAAFNDAQSSTNKAKVVFSNDASLDAALAKAIKTNGEGASAAAVKTDVRYITGISDTTYSFADADNESKDGLELTQLYVVKLDSEVNNQLNATTTMVRNPHTLTALTMTVGQVWNEDAAVAGMGRVIDAYAALLKDTTYVDGRTQADATFYNYSYTGTASMVSVDCSDGTVDYYFAFTVTQTTAEDTL